MPDGDPVDARPSRVECEFCECTLAPTGEVLKRGKRARALMDLDDQVVTLTAQVETLTAHIAAVEADNTTLKAALAACPEPPIVVPPKRRLHEDIA